MQVTTTSPMGRDVASCGHPMRIAEVLSQIRTPGYIARVAVHTPAHIVEAKRCIKQAFAYQAEGRCYTLVECLSTCPTNWGMTPIESVRWLEENMMPYYPLGVKRTPDDGEGGQT